MTGPDAAAAQADAAWGQGLAWRCLWILLALTAANALFLALASAPGPGGAGALLPQDDLFADFLKLVLSYPGAREVAVNPGLGLGPLLQDYIANNPYLGAEGLPQGQLTHMHMTPLSTAANLLALRLMLLAPPQAVFAAAVLCTGTLAGWVASVAGESQRERLAWLACLALSFPFLYLLQRGNLHSAACSLCLLLALALEMRAPGRLPALVLLAVAVNIRPNVLVLAPGVLLAGGAPWPRRFAILLGVSALLLLLGLGLAHALYPDYGPGSFLAGLRIYHALYVAGDMGMNHNSSLYALLRFLSGGHRGLWEAAGAAAAGALFLAALVLRRRLGTAAALLLLCLACMLGTTVFANYHLLILFLPLLALRLSEGEEDASPGAARLTCWTCLFLLAPKNYGMADGISAWVLLNPAAGLLAAGLLTALALRRARP